MLDLQTEKQENISDWFENQKHFIYKDIPKYQIESGNTW